MRKVFLLLAVTFSILIVSSASDTLQSPVIQDNNNSNTLGHGMVF